MKRLRHPAFVSTAIALLVFGLVLIIQKCGYLQTPELWVYDHHLKNRPPVQLDDPRIVLVTQTESQIQKYDFPLTDDVLADVLGKIEAQQPRAIGIDIYRGEPVPRHRATPPKLEPFLLGHPDIIWSFKYGDSTSEGVTAPACLRADLSRIGFNDWPVDDKEVRRGLLFLDNGKDVFTSLELQLALLYLARENPPVSLASDPLNPESPRLGSTTFRRFRANDGGYVGAEEGGYQFLLDYAGPRSFRTCTLEDVMNGKLPANFARDKIVLIGSMAESTNDFLRTPLNPHVPGVLIHAQCVNELLRAATIGDLSARVLNPWQDAAWVLLLSALGSLAAYRVRTPWLLIFFIAALSWSTWEVTVACFNHAWWIPFFPAWAALLLSAALTTVYIAHLETSDRQAVMELFQRNVSHKVAEELWQKRDKFAKGGRLDPHELTASVMFTDIRGFTTISERMNPPELLAWLNRYMDRIADQVDKHDGVVMKYAGDGIMAVFGFPTTRLNDAEIARDAVNAVRCALAMSAALEKLNQEYAAEDKPPIGMRVGIFTGTLVAGCMGPANRLEYATIGDTTNTASRLESFDKDKGMDPPTNCRILIGERTRQLIGPDFETIYVDKIKLKGKGEQTTIYRVLFEKQPHRSP